MFRPTPRQYKTSPRDLLQFIGMLDLWTAPCFKEEHQEIVVATTTWTGVLDTPRPMATLYITEKKGHEEMCGTIVLIDDTPRDAQPGAIELRLEGRPFHRFNPNAMWAPVIEKHFSTADCRIIVQDLHEVIATHWANHWFTSVPFEERY